MFKLSKILVPIDFSECSLVALTHALAITDESDASIDALHVVDTHTSAPERAEPGTARDAGRHTPKLDRAATELDTFLRHLQPAQRRRVVSWVEAGKPRESILNHARRDHYDLIVMGTNGRTGRAHAIAGSMAESVVRAAPCPVLTVQSHRVRGNAAEV